MTAVLRRLPRVLAELLLLHLTFNGVAVAFVLLINSLARSTSTGTAQGVMFMSNLPLILGFAFLAPVVTGRVLGDWRLAEGEGTHMPGGGRTVLLWYVILLAFLVMFANMGGFYLWDPVERLRQGVTHEFETTAALTDFVAADPDGVESSLRGVALHLPGLVVITEYNGFATRGPNRFDGSASSVRHWVWPVFAEAELRDGSARTPAHVWRSASSQAVSMPQPEPAEWFLAVTGEVAGLYREAVTSAQDSEPPAEPCIILQAIESPVLELERGYRRIRYAFIGGNLGPLLILMIWAAFGWRPEGNGTGR